MLDRSYAPRGDVFHAFVPLQQDELRHNSDCLQPDGEGPEYFKHVMRERLLGPVALVEHNSHRNAGEDRKPDMLERIQRSFVRRSIGVLEPDQVHNISSRCR